MNHAPEYLPYSRIERIVPIARILNRAGGHVSRTSHDTRVTTHETRHALMGLGWLGDGLTAVYIIIGEEWHYKKGRTARTVRYSVRLLYGGTARQASKTEGT